MIFASDNWAGAAPAIAKNLSEQAVGAASAYGTSELDVAVKARFNEIFEREVSVFFVGTGSIANSLALASLGKPGGFMLCHSEAHIVEDECGAPEFFTSGGRLLPVPGNFGKIQLDLLQAELDRIGSASVHHGQLMAISLTQATEAGTVYSLDEIEDICIAARNYKVPVHMDGARFANAMVRLGATPAEMTWKRGVDVLSFGATKNGCWCAEALVYFNPEMAEQMPFIQKRAGQLYSKSRFISAQFQAYFEDDLWIKLASHANARADQLRTGLKGSNRVREAWQTQANEIFVTIATNDADRLKQKGAVFGDWAVPHSSPDLLAEGEELCRFVASFATTEEEIGQLLSEIGALE